MTGTHRDSIVLYLQFLILRLESFEHVFKLVNFGEVCSALVFHIFHFLLFPVPFLFQLQNISNNMTKYYNNCNRQPTALQHITTSDTDIQQHDNT